jgi:predicted YcjX-like family ATPase
VPDAAGGDAGTGDARGRLNSSPGGGFDPLGEVFGAARAFRTLLLGNSQETVRLAVTGLSRAGKTVFTAALAANLLAIPADPRRMSRLSAAADRRILAVREPVLGISDAPLFPLHAALAALSGDAVWPEPTTKLSKLALEIDIEPVAMAWLERQIAPPLRTVRLEISDYPGEWLLDLPLLELGFEDYSRRELARAREPARAALSQAFLAALGRLDPGAEATQARLAEPVEAYTDYLKACREAGLVALTPGRFLNPDTWAGMPFMLFCPLSPSASGAPRPGSVAYAMRAHYAEYLARTRSEFLEPHFARFDAQIMLVDLFRALTAGAASFEETRVTLAEIARVLKPEGSWLDLFGLLAAPPPKPVFVATKADYVPASQRAQLKTLMRSLVGEAANAEVVAAARCTEDVVIQDRGRPVEAVEGLVEGAGREAFWLAGGVPVEPPSQSWFDHRYAMPVFAPPAFDPVRGLRHLNLDGVLAAAVPELFA